MIKKNDKIAVFSPYNVKSEIKNGFTEKYNYFITSFLLDKLIYEIVQMFIKLFIL